MSALFPFRSLDANASLIHAGDDAVAGQVRRRQPACGLVGAVYSQNWGVICDGGDGGFVAVLPLPPAPAPHEEGTVCHARVP